MTLYKNIDSNKQKTWLFLFLFLMLIIILGWIFSYIYNSYFILVIAVVVALTQALVAYYSGDKVALSIAGARKIEKKDDPKLWNIVENLSITAGLSMPKIYLIMDSAPNAFATGRDPEHSSIAVTTGLMEELNKSELEGVIAHEMSHIGNYDIRLMMIIVVLVGAITLISDLFIRFGFWGGFGGRRRDSGGGQLGYIMLIIGIVAAVLAPIAAALIQLAISRKREFLADASGAMLTRYPEGLASALEKISKYSQPLRKASGSTAHLYISNPLGKKQSYFSKLFSTHPPIKERIKKLREIYKSCMKV